MWRRVMRWNWGCVQIPSLTAEGKPRKTSPLKVHLKAVWPVTTSNIVSYLQIKSTGSQSTSWEGWWIQSIPIFISIWYSICNMCLFQLCKFSQRMNLSEKLIYAKEIILSVEFFILFFYLVYVFLVNKCLEISQIVVIFTYKFFLFLSLVKWIFVFLYYNHRRPDHLNYVTLR